MESNVTGFLKNGKMVLVSFVQIPYFCSHSKKRDAVTRIFFLGALLLPMLLLHTPDNPAPAPAPETKPAAVVPRSYPVGLFSSPLRRPL